MRRVHGGFPDIGCLDPYKRKLHISCLELKAVMLHLPCDTGPQCSRAPGYDRYGHFDSFLGQQTRRDTLSHLVTFNSQASPRLEVQSDIVRARLFLGCLNVIADHLSRPKQPIPTEWSLHPEIVCHICRVWGTLEIDMYATVSNSLLPRLMSPMNMSCQ